MVIYYRPQQLLWEGNVFTGICQLFCSGGAKTGTRSFLGGLGGYDWSLRVGYVQ